MKSSSRLLNEKLKQPIALGTWLVLAILAVIAPSNLPLPMLLVILALVSTSSAISALLLFEKIAVSEKQIKWKWASTITISFAIPLTWFWFLGFQGSHDSTLIQMVVAFFPSAIALAVAAFTPCASVIRNFSQTQNNDQNLDDTLVNADHPTHLAYRLWNLENGNGDIETEIDSERSPNVTQWLTRSVTADGEVIEGGVRIDFSEGQREATVHVSFCPPFQTVPEVMTEDLDGADLEIRVSAAFVFGARLNVRRSGLAVERDTRFSAANHRIGFFALAAPVRKVA